MAAASAPLVGLEDRKDTNIGRIVRLTDTEVDLLEINSDAEWDAEPTTYVLDTITLLAFGDEYDDRLYAFGGEPPTTDKTG